MVYIFVFLLGVVAGVWIASMCQAAKERDQMDDDDFEREYKKFLEEAEKKND